MPTRELQAYGELANDSHRRVLGRTQWSSVPALPILRALAAGFGLGLLVSGALALFVQ